ncbi:hypothetical protein [Zunongwangia sp. HRR-M8]|uniref:hypothetical protein n=1 Tax=Zunongwangia sp. HRR-M8 TaxID=3015170 RepID=UPI0022DDCDDB|nr:hypothetical protein [Zunongwangia sp. HRR-M8]WBL20755.1 hypothetical protein PBT89_08410 [Zunongwangia sp. HRR-M8]
MNLEITVCIIISCTVLLIYKLIEHCICMNVKSEIDHFEKIGQCYQNKPISKQDPPEPEQKLIKNDNKINRQSLITFLHLELRAISLAKESHLLRGDDKAMRNCDFEIKSIKRVLEHLDILK